MSIATLGRSITLLNKEISEIASGRGGAAKHDKASRIAFLAGKVGTVMDSMRKVDALRARRLENLTPAQILSWLRQLDPDERQQFLAEAVAIDARKSGLG